MIGLRLRHPESNITGTVDAEAVHPDASVMVRIADMWFPAGELVAVVR
jgi:hypothetical protein